MSPCLSLIWTMAMWNGGRSRFKIPSRDKITSYTHDPLYIFVPLAVCVFHGSQSVLPFPLAFPAGSSRASLPFLSAERHAASRRVAALVAARQAA